MFSIGNTTTTSSGVLGGASLVAQHVSNRLARTRNERPQTPSLFSRFCTNVKDTYRKSAVRFGRHRPAAPVLIEDTINTRTVCSKPVTLPELDLSPTSCLLTSEVEHYYEALEHRTIAQHTPTQKAEVMELDCVNTTPTMKSSSFDNANNGSEEDSDHAVLSSTSSVYSSGSAERTCTDSEQDAPSFLQITPLQDQESPTKSVILNADILSSKPGADLPCLYKITTSNNKDSNTTLTESPYSLMKQRKLQKLAWAVGKVKFFVNLNFHLSPRREAVLPEALSTEENDMAEEEEERCQWHIIRKIPLKTYRSLILSLPFATNLLNAFVYHATRGSYHYAFFIKALNNQRVVEKFIVKVPGHGTPDRWTAEDGYMLEREVETMKLVHSKTSVPVPKVMAWSSTLDNSVGFPYVVMEYLGGQDASNIWYDQAQDCNDTFQPADFPSLDIEQKRINFLRSLAGVMTELDKITFDGIGLPYAVNGTDSETCRYPVGETHVWPSAMDVHYLETRDPSKSTQEYTMAARQAFVVPNTDTNEEGDQDQREVLGVYKLLDMVLSHSVFQSKSGDTFVLQHDDLDLQNILTDADGNITGIIDWDGSMAMPRCVGHAAVPKFLQRDWFPGGVTGRPRLICRAQQYRDIYAAAMVEAGNLDARYTSKSAIYQAAFAALYEGGDIFNFATKICRAIPDFFMPTNEFVAFLASPNAWKVEPWLKQNLDKILDPELPATSFAEINASMALNSWMFGFDGLLKDGFNGK
jgi:aminoglycoside phosphotransferase (APT) family kinase protein